MEIDELISGIVIKKVNKMSSKAPTKPAEILNPSSPRFFSFLNPTLLDFSGKTPAKPFGN